MFLAITQQRKVKITLMTPFWKGEGQGFQMDEKQIEFKFQLMNDLKAKLEIFKNFTNFFMYINEI